MAHRSPKQGRELHHKIEKRKHGAQPGTRPTRPKGEERVYRAQGSKSEYKREGSARSGSKVGLTSDGQGGA
jgi:hypothetical protein